MLKRLLNPRWIICFFFLPGLLFATNDELGLSINTVDLNTYPKAIKQSSQKSIATIGDLHGNALKLIYFLIQQHALVLSEASYEKLVAIYHKPVEQLTANDLQTFKHIINYAKTNHDTALRFLGDDVSDRGMNDYFTLLVFAKLDRTNVPFKVVISNHGLFFLRAYESAEQSFLKNPYGDARRASIVRSMLNLGRLIERGLVSQNEVIKLIETHYLPHLVLPDFEFDRRVGQITIFTHAPVDLRIIEALAFDLGLPFDKQNVTTLAESMEQMNQLIRSWVASKSFVKNYEHYVGLYQSFDKPSPLKQLLWNRNYTILNRGMPFKNAPYEVFYVHGHDSNAHVIDLDNLLGKSDGHDVGPYAIYTTYLDAL